LKRAQLYGSAEKLPALKGHDFSRAAYININVGFSR